ncbi:hypothetical protein N2152v2_009347 [Parachlorella kessleri]
MRHLHCRRCEPRPVLDALPLLRSITSLDLSCCKFEAGELPLQQLPALASLSLEDCGLGSAPQALQACTRLTKLELSHNPLGCKDSRLDLPEGLTLLQHVDLAHCDLQLFPGLPQAGLPHLTYLNFDGNSIPEFPADQQSWLLNLLPVLSSTGNINNAHCKAAA